MSLNKNLDIYEAVIEDEGDGITFISLVNDPAVESNWFAYNKEHQPMQFQIADEEQHILLGVIMRADFPMYRIGNSGYEYYIKYSKETIAKMARKMLDDKTFNYVDTEHNNQCVDGVKLEELFIKDVDKGINPVGFEDIENGSLFGKYRVLNDEVWADVKAGKFKGFSLEGYFGIVESKFIKQKNHMSLLEKLKKLLTEFKAFETIEGVTLEVDGDTLGVGQMVDVPDGTYHTDTVTVKVEKGVITEVETLEVEDVVEDVVENMAEEPEPMVEEPEPMVEPEPTEEKPSEMEELKTLVQQIVAEVEKIKKQLADTTALPIDEVAKKCEPKQLNSRALEIAKAIKELNCKQ